MSRLLDGLNPPQRDAAATIQGPLLILAGAGSGKTRVLTHRIAHMLEQGVDPRQILAVTFTNKAAGEMKHRVEALVGDVARRMLVTTFHSACVRFLRQDIQTLGYPRSFAIYDTDDQKRLAKRVLDDAGIRSKEWTPRKLLGIVDRAKNRMQSPADLGRRQRTVGDPSARLYGAYQEQLVAAGAVDFNDLLNLVVRLWRDHPDVLARYQRRFEYVMVDEYQDTNRAQYELIRLLMQRPAGVPRNIAVVGDDDQSIYAFRGADIRNILDFERDFPDTKVVRLEQNYRSTGHILSAAHAVVQHNGGRMDKKLWTDKGDGAPVRVRVAQDDSQEAEQAVEEIRRQVQAGRRRWGDFAVIYRTNASSRPFEQCLVRAGIPHVLVGARKFYERREVRDMLAYLKLVLNPADDMAFMRVINVPRRGIGAKSVDQIRAIADQDGVPMLQAARRWGQGRGKAKAGALRFVELVEHMAEEARTVPPGRLVEQIAEDSGYAPALRLEGTDEARGRLDNIAALVTAVEEPFDDAELMGDLFAEEARVDLSDPMVRLQMFVDRVSLAGQDEDLPDSEDEGKVTLLTAHLAKGLEFPVVHVVGMYEGGFPHFRSLEREEDIEEERRLVYVAMTRAQEELVLGRPRRRMIPGQGFGPAEPSRFLGDLPSEGVKIEGGWSRSGARGRDRALASRGAERAAYRGPAGLSASSSRRFARRATKQASAPRQASLPGLGGPPPEADDADLGEVRTRTPSDVSDLQPGTQVLHPKLGRGTIQSTEGSPSNLKLVVHFQRHGRKKLLLRHAKLEILLS